MMCEVLVQELPDVFDAQRVVEEVHDVFARVLGHVVPHGLRRCAQSSLNLTVDLMTASLNTAEFIKQRGPCNPFTSCSVMSSPVNHRGQSSIASCPSLRRLDSQPRPRADTTSDGRHLHCAVP